MPRTHTWSRASNGQTITTGGRFALALGDFPAGSTLERVVFGYYIRQNAFYGGLTPGPRSLHLRIGVIAQAVSAGTPDIDPAAPTTADWLWAGLVVADVIPLRFMSDKEYHVAFSSPPEQLETQSRRHNGLGESQRVWLCTSPISERDSGFDSWSATSYGSTLYSQLSP